MVCQVSPLWYEVDCRKNLLCIVETQILQRYKTDFFCKLIKVDHLSIGLDGGFVNVVQIVFVDPHEEVGHCFGIIFWKPRFSLASFLEAIL